MILSKFHQRLYQNVSKHIKTYQNVSKNIFRIKNERINDKIKCLALGGIKSIVNMKMRVSKTKTYGKYSTRVSMIFDMRCVFQGAAVTPAAVTLAAGGRPSTWSPPGRLVEHDFNAKSL